MDSPTFEAMREFAPVVMIPATAIIIHKVKLAVFTEARARTLLRPTHMASTTLNMVLRNIEPSIGIESFSRVRLMFPVVRSLFINGKIFLCSYIPQHRLPLVTNSVS